MSRLVRIVLRWLPLGIGIVGMATLVYIVAQQAHRQNANDPQIALARDAAAALGNGAGAETLLLEGQVDVAHSLATFITIYGENGALLATTGDLDGQPPSLPAGVLDYTRRHGEDRITWQPRADVRIATVIVHAPGNAGGFVLAGRSLREVEQRVDQLGVLTAGVAGATLLASLLAVALAEVLDAANRPPSPSQKTRTGRP